MHWFWRPMLTLRYFFLFSNNHCVFSCRPELVLPTMGRLKWSETSDIPGHLVLVIVVIWHIFIYIHCLYSYVYIYIYNKQITFCVFVATYFKIIPKCQVAEISSSKKSPGFPFNRLIWYLSRSFWLNQPATCNWGWTILVPEPWEKPFVKPVTWFLLQMSPLTLMLVLIGFDCHWFIWIVIIEVISGFIGYRWLLWILLDACFLCLFGIYRFNKKKQDFLLGCVFPLAFEVDLGNLRAPPQCHPPRAIRP